MDGLGAHFIDDRDAERLAALREQRMRIGELRDDLERAVRMLAADDLRWAWRSAAQAGYAERLEELRGDLGRAGRYLDDALAAVHESIATLTATR